MVRHPQTGKYRRTRLFVLTLGYCRKAVRLLAWQSSTQTWAELHERAFRRLGGAPPRHRPRQSERGRAHARHLRAGAQSALPRHARPLRRRRAAVSGPRSRPKGQGRVGHRPHAEDAAPGPALRDARRGAGLSRSLGDALGRHAHPRHDQAPGRGDVCGGAPALLPLPVEPFRYYQFGERTVHLDGCVEVEAAYYAPPPGWIGRRVQVQWDDLHVRILDPKTGQLLREHLRAPRGHHRIDDATGRRAHRRPRCAPRAERGTPAHAIGTRLRRDPPPRGRAGVRRILGVLALARSTASPSSRTPPGRARARRARRIAFSAGTSSAGRPVPLTLTQVDPLIRQLTLYRDLIDRRTGDPE